VPGPVVELRFGCFAPFGAGALSGTWKPSNRDLLAEGYRGATPQVCFGIGANWLGEFAPDIKRILQAKKRPSVR
jgi:hypothetical protein